MYNNYNNWHALSPKGSEMEVHKLRTQEMMHDTHNYYDPEVPNFDKNKNGYYDQFEKNKSHSHGEDYLQEVWISLYIRTYLR